MRDDMHRDENEHEVRFGSPMIREEGERELAPDADVRHARLGPIHVTTASFGAKLPGRGTLLLAGIVALIIGGAFLAIGIVLLATLAVAGAALGGGYLLVRRLRGLLRGNRAEPRGAELEPMMEIRPIEGETPRGKPLPRE